ncbi:single-stranded-DNA-specific exonuclease [Maridesulfovibrio ferrireducens]|uniref:Single-stranded-DNA-specific exonuclease RecJ n=1 Tax=Maridesulfovibrio ferrireducens TaxID=246191 RepID=A0A1G9JBE5_9BACT|nr:single-stranded-DNA-specific exonuclease RecJ [Maridesulfovibrio ferrireducens]SDL34711.1 single-stranded-DNA-specific exonuclease [Maridesulfovibrio ferrireducens]
MPSIWKLRSEEEVPSSLSVLAAELGITDLLAEILWHRGFKTRNEMDFFLSPGLRNLCKPTEVPGAEEAAKVLVEGLTQGKKFAVWGDYDVDGITSTALVKSFLESRGFECAHHLPNRIEEGYGLNIPHLKKLSDEGIDLLLTVDCGITNNAEIAAANEMGMTVVVSDHHLPSDELPPAAAVCNPRITSMNGKTYDCPCDALAGVGVAFMLMAQMNRLLPGDPVDLRQYLDFVALGTIADVVELQGHNRILVKNGLLLLKEAKRPGLAALKVVSGYDMFAAIGAGQVGFGLAPRINASGRMGDPDKALDLLLAADMETARPIAKELDTLNSERRAEEDRILKEALAQAEEQSRPPHNRAGLVLFSPDWHPGIIGIVASRVVEKYYRPTIMLCEDEGVIKGSARSIREFHIHEALTGMSELFTNFGGHKLAAGMSFPSANFKELRERFDTAVIKVVGTEPLKPTLKVDKELPLENIDYVLLKELELMQPFGMGNPEPVFTTPPVEILERRPMGKEHVKLTISDIEKTRRMPAKAWRMAEKLGSELIGKKMRFAFSPKIDKFNGIPTIELTIRDFTRKLK